MVAVAADPAARVETVPTVRVFAGPCWPVTRMKSRTAEPEVPELVTVPGPG